MGPREHRTVLIFDLGPHACALPIDEIPEVLLMPALVHLPAQPMILDGFLNLRGTAVPVLPLHRLFDIPAPEPDLHTPLILVRSAANLLGYRVDRLQGVAGIDSAALQAYAAEDSFNCCAEVQFTMDGREV